MFVKIATATPLSLLIYLSCTPGVVPLSIATHLFFTTERI
jgi:hypothetical protein